MEFKGEYVRIPKSIIEPKPIQKPHPPVYMAVLRSKLASAQADSYFHSLL